MAASELHARSVIAAALISSGSVAVPPLPITGVHRHGTEARRLRALTDYIFTVLTEPRTGRAWRGDEQDMP